MTGYGFTGPMTARGTVFAPKDAGGGSGGQVMTGTRYRYGYRLNYGASALLTLLVCWGVYAVGAS